MKHGAAMRDLNPAPAVATAWDADSIFTLLIKAQARPLRRTARAMLKARPALLEKVPFGLVFEMLDHSDSEIQTLGLELLAAPRDWSPRRSTPGSASSKARTSTCSMPSPP